MKKIGKYTLAAELAPRFESAAAIGGKEEKNGPLGSLFDLAQEDAKFGCKTWEQAESQMQRLALDNALAKQALTAEDLDFLVGGDLENQCTATSYSSLGMGVPYIGLYGACSTMALGLALAAILTSQGAARRAAAVTSSHFCTAERQFRYPLEYGGQRPPTSQWTVTGSGASIICAAPVCTNASAPCITSVTIGRAFELGVTDINNMGAAMAPAAADTLLRHFADTCRKPSDYDLIITGDLGQMGSQLLLRLLAEGGLVCDGKTEDCGCLIYDRSDKKYGSGGSGCGASAAVVNSLLFRMLSSGQLKSALFVGTGALMSPVSVYQGEVIPAIAHAVAFAAPQQEEKWKYC